MERTATVMLQVASPALLGIGSKYSRDQVTAIITHGRRMMPAFTRLDENQQKAVVGFLFGDEEKQQKIPRKTVLGSKPGADSAVSYSISGYSKFVDKNGWPAISPPWGTLNAIDLNTGEYLWKVTLGETPELKAKGIPQTGCESYGGPVVTASGLLFIAGTKDGYFRVYDKTNGKLLWQTQLPAGGFATPATYEENGKQYIVIACGGQKLGTKAGDSYVAFALP
jgi:quinoprotein glucose dehydrogenase